VVTPPVELRDVDAPDVDPADVPAPPLEVAAGRDALEEDALWAGCFLCAAGGFFFAGAEVLAGVLAVGAGVVLSGGVEIVVTGTVLAGGM
jgi:hypothetical protein